MNSSLGFMAFLFPAVAGSWSIKRAPETSLREAQMHYQDGWRRQLNKLSIY
jgi:hypothetical protein